MHAGKNEGKNDAVAGKNAAYFLIIMHDRKTSLIKKHVQWT